MMEMSEGGGVGNAAFDATGDDLDSRQQQATEKTGQVDTSTWSGKDGEKEGPLKTCYSKVFKSAIGLVIFLSWAATMQGIIVNGLINVNITTLERRFSLKSVTSGWIATFYDLGSLLTVIPITYFGGRPSASKPRYISMGLFLMGFGSLLFYLPHFITGPYTVDSSASSSSQNGSLSETCQASYVSNPDVEDTIYDDIDQTVEAGDSELKASAEASIAYLRTFKWFFFFGQFFHGVGAAPLITLGTTVIDESVDRHAAPLYIGIFQTFLVIGPAVGYIAGGSTLSFYVDFDTVTAPDGLTSTSALWVGAWWTGFVIAWVLTWSCALFVFFFPKKIEPKVLPTPQQQESQSPRKTTTVSLARSNSIISYTVKPSGDSSYGHIKDLPRNVWQLVKNPTYMFITLGSAFDGMVVSGLSTFGPKYIQAQFGYSASYSSTMLGAAIVPAGGLGTFLGGWLAKKFNLTRYQILVMYIVCQLFATPFIFGLYSKCSAPSLVVDSNRDLSSLERMVDLSVNESTSSVFGVDECNKDCAAGCQEIGFKPVCGADKRIYFSACFAGCDSAKYNQEDGSVVFKGCKCVKGTSEEQTASSESCLSECPLFPGILVGVAGFVWFTFMAAMPTVVATLRYVEPLQRSLALGFATIFFRLLGSIPGPLAFGSCLVYDNDRLADSLIWFSVGVKVLVIMFYGVTLYTGKHSKVPEESQDDN